MSHYVNILNESNNWNNEIYNLLDKIRINSIYLSEKHRKNFFLYKKLSNYFDLPVLILSSIGSSFSVGGSIYFSNEKIQLINCGIGLLIAVLTSIKIYLNLDDTIRKEVDLSKEFYVLGIDIFKILNLNVNDKEKIEAYEYLDKKYGEYILLYQKSNLLNNYFKKDKLIEGVDIITNDNSRESSKNNSNENSKINTPKELNESIEIIELNKHLKEIPL